MGTLVTEPEASQLMTQPDNSGTQPADGGSVQWWTAIVETYLSPLYRFVRSHVPADNVDDIVQETFVAAALAAARFDRSRQVWPWLVTIARHKIADHYRQTGRPDALTGPLTWLADDHDRVQLAITDESPLPDEIAQQAEFAALARAALSSLDPSHRECLVARYYNELSLEQIAEDRGLSRAAANSLLYRARGELRLAFLQLAGKDTAPEDCGQ